ncbi:MAG: flavin reductase family protein [Thermodesulfobacteriota bacterium]|nr:flavin reductase family protein [Thermodesulfobacteriota bacterium]
MSECIDSRAFRHITYGLYIVCSVHEGKRNGQIVNTVFQVTANPPRIAVSVNKENLTHEYISKSGLFSVSVLDESTPMKLIGTFGFRCGRDTDKFSFCTNLRIGGMGCPIVMDHVLSVIEARVFDSVDVGTHNVFFGDVISAEVSREGKPLTYAYYQEVLKGRSPKNAPTYEAHVNKEE